MGIKLAIRKPPQNSRLQLSLPQLSRLLTPQRLFCLITLLYSITCVVDISHGLEAREESKPDIPYELFAAKRREEVKKIITAHTTYRVIHDIEFKTDESVLIFMIDHPVFLSATLKAMKIRDYFVKYADNGMYLFDDQKGVRGKFEVIYHKPRLRYYYGFGGYYGLILKLVGRTTVSFEYRGLKGNPPRTLIDINVYTKIDNVIIDFLMKILKPVIIPLMDKKIYRFVEVTQKLANEITMHPKIVYQAIKESGDANRNELEEFRKLIF